MESQVFLGSSEREANNSEERRLSAFFATFLARRKRNFQSEHLVFIASFRPINGGVSVLGGLSFFFPRVHCLPVDFLSISFGYHEQKRVGSRSTFVISKYPFFSIFLSS